MECTQKQQPMVCAEMPTPIKIKRTEPPKETEVYDRESAELRRHLASEEALRQLEHRKSFSMAAAYRMSLIR